VHSRAAPAPWNSTIAEPACQGTVFEVRMECQNHRSDMPVTRFKAWALFHVRAAISSSAFVITIGRLCDGQTGIGVETRRGS
jgi:hypothetical protein